MCPLSRRGLGREARRLSASLRGLERDLAADVKTRVDRPVANVVDAVKVGAKLLDVGPEPRQIAERLVEIGQQRLERHQNADAQAADDDFVDPPGRGPRSPSGSPEQGGGRARAYPRTPRDCSALIIRAWSPLQRTSRSDSEPAALTLSMIWIAHMTPAKSRPRICSIARFRSARQRLNHWMATRLRLLIPTPTAARSGSQGSITAT